MTEIIKGISKYGWRLSKLKLSNINLNDVKLVQEMVWMMQNQSKVLYSLDLSWTNLSAHSMYLIADQLNLHPWTFKYINLSYNNLNFKPGHPDEEKSLMFVDKMMIYIKKTDMLNHLDLSGLCFMKD